MGGWKLSAESLPFGFAQGRNDNQRYVQSVVDMGAEEGGHVGVGFAGFGESYVVPEGVGEGFEDDEAGVYALAEEGAVKDGGAAEQEIAGAGDEEGGWETVQIGEDGGEDGIVWVGGADVLGVEGLAGCGWGEVAGEAVEGVHGAGVVGLREVTEAGEDAEGGGLREVELLEADGDLGGEDGAGGGAVDGDVLGLVGLEELAVDGDGVVEAGGEGVLGCEAVEDGNDAGMGEIGDGDGLGEGAGVGVEAAAVEVDEDAVGVGRGGVNRGDVADGDAGEGGLGDVDGKDGGGGFAGSGLPGVGTRAAMSEGFVGVRIRLALGETMLGLWADRGGDGDDAGDVGGAIGVDVAGVRHSGLGLLRGEGERKEESDDGEEEAHADDGSGEMR